MSGDDDRITGDGKTPKPGNDARDGGEAKETVKEKTPSTTADQDSDTSVPKSDAKLPAPPPESPDVAEDVKEEEAQEEEPEKTSEVPPPVVKADGGGSIHRDANSANETLPRRTSRLTMSILTDRQIGEIMLVIAIFMLVLAFPPILDAISDLIFGPKDPTPDPMVVVDPNYRDSNAGTVRRLMLTGRDSTAYEVSKTLTVQDSLNSTVWSDHGLICYRTQKVTAAESAYTMSLTLDQDNPWNKVSLAATKLKRAEIALDADTNDVEPLLESAEGLLLEARISLSQCPELFINLGRAKYLRGYDRAAAAYYDSAMKLDSTLPHAEYYKDYIATYPQPMAFEASP